MRLAFTTQRFRRRTRIEAWAAVLLTLAGCGYGFAALWAPWAVDGQHAAVVQDLSGWQWMKYGDVLMFGALAALVVLVGALCFGTFVRPAPGLIGGAALVLIVLAATGATAVWALTGWYDTMALDLADQPKYSQGAGARRTVIGLGIVAFGVVTAMHLRTRDRPHYPPVQLGRLAGQVELLEGFDDPLEEFDAV